MAKSSPPRIKLYAARDLRFHACACCEPNRKLGAFVIPEGTEGILVHPSSRQQRDLDRQNKGLHQGSSERMALVEIEGRERYLRRSDVLSEKQYNARRERRKARLQSLRQERTGSVGEGDGGAE